MSMPGAGELQALCPRPPQRVVSLVPSLTESLFDMGLGAAVVGVTDYCTSPAAALQGVPRLGGAKNPRLKDILALHPDLVLMNQEENPLPVYQALRERGVVAWVVFPKSVSQALDVLWELAGAFQSQAALLQLQALERALDWARAAAEARPRRARYFCPIWQGTLASGQGWWMTFNQDTYMSDLLAICGGENAFAGRERRQPLEADLGLAPPREDAGGDRRYPRVSLEEIRAADPELILLPDEPYAYDAAHKEALSALLEGVSAVREGRVHLVEGSLIAWHGTRLGQALQFLPAFFLPAFIDG
ncbi:MAG: helical backbone metal receptor [Anaerolineales bacterium]|nr:helical backbone metal receptor [Anaerolineales bacterium]